MLLCEATGRTLFLFESAVDQLTFTNFRVTDKAARTRGYNDRDVIDENVEKAKTTFNSSAWTIAWLRTKAQKVITAVAHVSRHQEEGRHARAR